MRVKEIGRLIAQRELRGNVDGKSRSVRVLVGEPVRIPEEGKLSAYYECPIQVIGAGDDHIQSIAGEDSMQALVLALKFLGTELARIQEHFDLTWEGEHDLGFPALNLRTNQ
jgi:hypothetical protein